MLSFPISNAQALETNQTLGMRFDLGWCTTLQNSPFLKALSEVSNEKKQTYGYLGYIGDYTTQLYVDYNKPL